MQIYIPTFGRSDRQITYLGLPPALQRRTKLVVQRSEAKLYADFPHVVLPPSITTVAPTRQWIITKGHEAYGGGDPFLVMLDDDLRWAERRTDDPSKFIASDAKSVARLFAEIERQLKSHAHVGVSARESAHTNAEPVRHATRMTRVLAYDYRVLQRLRVRFDRLPVQEDFDVTLQLLRLGYANAVINGWVHNQDGSNARGGCSHFRTPAMQAETSQKLAGLHAPFVKVVIKTPLKAWGGGPRTDVVVAWKQAYKSAKVKV